MGDKSIKGRSPRLLDVSKELEAVVEGTKKVSENQKKFKTLISPPWVKNPMRIKVPKRIKDSKKPSKN